MQTGEVGEARGFHGGTIVRVESQWAGAGLDLGNRGHLIFEELQCFPMRWNQKYCCSCSPQLWSSETIEIMERIASNRVYLDPTTGVNQGGDEEYCQEWEDDQKNRVKPVEGGILEADRVWMWGLQINSLTGHGIQHHPCDVHL